MLLAYYDNSTSDLVPTDHLGKRRLRTTLDRSVYDSPDYRPSVNRPQAPPAQAQFMKTMPLLRPDRLVSTSVFAL